MCVLVSCCRFKDTRLFDSVVFSSHLEHGPRSQARLRGAESIGIGLNLEHLSRRYGEAVSSLASGPRADSLPWFNPPVVQGVSRLQVQIKLNAATGGYSRGSLGSVAGRSLVLLLFLCSIYVE